MSAEAKIEIHFDFCSLSANIFMDVFPEWLYLINSVFLKDASLHLIIFRFQDRRVLDSSCYHIAQTTQ